MEENQKIRPGYIELGGFAHFCGWSLEQVINELLASRIEVDFKYYVNFNGHIFYNDDITMDKAYLEITGRTKTEDEEYWRIKREEWKKESVEAKQKAIANIPNWIERGKPFIFKQRHNNWAKMVENRAKDIYHGLELDCALEFMEALDNGATMEKVVETMEKQGHSGWSASIVRHIMLHFATKGPEFFEATAYRELTSEERIALIFKKHENLALLSKQHSKTQIKKLFKSIDGRNIIIVKNVSHLTASEFKQFSEDIKKYTDEQIKEKYGSMVELKQLTINKHR